MLAEGSLCGTAVTWLANRCTPMLQEKMSHLDNFSSYYVHIRPIRVTPWTTAHQTPLSRRFSRQGYWSGQPFPFPGDLPNSRVKPGFPELQADSLPSEPPGKPNTRNYISLFPTATTNPIPASNLQTAKLKNMGNILTVEVLFSQIPAFLLYVYFRLSITSQN